MNKEEFLTELQNGLSGLPQEDIAERLSFYSEMIDDRIEEGYSESEAVAGIGSVDQIVSQTVAEVPFAKLVKEKITPKRQPQAWEIVLIVLGFPLWFPLLIAAGAVLLSFYLVIWSLILSLWAVEVSLWASALGGAVAGVVYFVHGDGLPGIAMLGAVLFCAGLSIFLFFGCAAASKGILFLTKKVACSMKTKLVKKETAK
ncbi:MAG: DUF1700 domain-containing protein [Clostridia bacterium]|nr:DUF1700 domain-containing protein [Clostridia bacterium]